MLLEINLVFSQSIYSNAFTLITRDRVMAENDEQVLSEISKFIRNHIETFDSAIADKDLVNRLQTVELNTVSELYSLKFMISTFGLDILPYQVAELEVNPQEVSENTIEYNIIDELESPEKTFVKPTSKVIITNESGDLHTVYSKIIEGFGFFDSDLVAGFNNPLTRDLTILKQSEELMGVSPVPITTDINSILEYLGKKVVAIMN